MSTRKYRTKVSDKSVRRFWRTGLCAFAKLQQSNMLFISLRESIRRFCNFEMLIFSTGKLQGRNRARISKESSKRAKMLRDQTRCV